MVIVVIAVWTSTVVSQQVPPGVTTGFPCETTPNFCDRVYCVPPSKCENGIIVKGGGNCGCCEVCLTYQGINDACEGVEVEPAKVPDGVVAQYYKNPTLCHPGLVCDKTCQKPTSLDSCVYHLFEFSSNDWEFPPKCDFYGNYDYKRCKDSSNPRCFCVDKAGDTIFGRLPTGSENVTCACSRVTNDIKAVYPMLEAVMKCTETGDFSEMQCWDGVCFCVDKDTQIMTSVAVPMAAINVLPCWDSSLYTTTFYGDCQIEYTRQSAIIEEFALKGLVISPIDLPSCDPDGTYGFVQFQSNKYYCSDREGVQIDSYFIDASSSNYDDYKKMICNCARDSEYPDGLPDGQHIGSCDNLGNYNNKLCVQDSCVCLDSDGQQCSNTFKYDDTTVDCSDPSTFPAQNSG